MSEALTTVEDICLLACCWHCRPFEKFDDESSVAQEFTSHSSLEAQLRRRLVSDMRACLLLVDDDPETFPNEDLGGRRDELEVWKFSLSAVSVGVRLSLALLLECREPILCSRTSPERSPRS